MRPDGTIGEVETCYEGDESASLGYKAYFGYKSCKSDESKGEMWMQDPSNPRKCVCNRTSDTLGHLPYGIDDYFNESGSGGFNTGYYGTYRSCSDPDGTYYGYTMCYTGRVMSSKGRCTTKGPTGYLATYPYLGIYYVNNALAHWGLPQISATSEPRSSAQAYCVHQYTHCKDRNGKTLGDADVCALVPSGCNLGYEAACNLCYHIASIQKGNDGLYHLNPDYQIIVDSCRETAKYIGITKCPLGLQKASGRNACYGYCYTSDMSKCFPGYVLIDDANSNTKLGVIYIKSGNTLFLQAKDGYRYDTWYNAMNISANYAPAGYENHPIFGRGKWKIPDSGQTLDNASHISAWPIYGTFYKEGWNSGSTWTTATSGDMAYYVNVGSADVYYPKSTALNYSIILILRY